MLVLGDKGRNGENVTVGTLDTELRKDLQLWLRTESGYRDGIRWLRWEKGQDWNIGCQGFEMTRNKIKLHSFQDYQLL